MATRPPPAPRHAPLFELFWDNSALNPTRALKLAERIGLDAAQPFVPWRPLHAAAAQPLPPATSSLAKAYARRHSARSFSGVPIDVRALSNVLRPFAARSADERSTRLLPSGGGKYPILVYLALYDVARAPELNGRIAWYDPQAHGLASTGVAPAWPAMARALGVSEWSTRPAVVVLLAAHAAGSVAKYGERGGRFLLLEAGAYMGALSHQVAEAGLVGTALGSFMDADLLRAFGLGASGELAVIAYACGA